MSFDKIANGADINVQTAKKNGPNRQDKEDAKVKAAGQRLSNDISKQMRDRADPWSPVKKIN